ncbi:MAG TPA: hypothetical protein VMD92_07495 [Acidobacteriaceae bacterium]|jgi:hypothetical protein|nr:hypothetical protein [Acidobacteriaceae bacterium]
MKKTAVSLTLAALAAGAVCAGAQEINVNPGSQPKPPDHFYKLNLVVQEMNEAGKVTNERTFVAVVETSGGFTQSIRSDDRVPAGTVTDVQYMRVGVDFDIRDVKDVGSELGFRLSADVNGFAAPDAGTSMVSSPTHPIIRENRWEAGILIPIGKPTVAFSADSEEGQGKMQVVVTATRVE